MLNPFSYISDYVWALQTVKAARGFGANYIGGKRNEPVWTARDYANFVKFGYKGSVWVYRCIREIAEGLQMVPWITERLVDEKEGIWEEVPGHEMTKLLANPNPDMSGADLIERWAIDMNLAGSAYWEIVATGVDNAGKPKELWPLRPDWIKAIPGDENVLEGWVLDPGTGTPIEYRRDELLHWKFPDPLDELKGMSPIEVAARIIDTEIAAIAWNKSLIDNAATPSGVLTVPENVNLHPRRRKLLEAMLQKKFSKENAHRAMLLEGGMMWHTTSINPKDMDFLKGRIQVALEICALLGVPPELIGAREAKYENYGIARLSFWEETVFMFLNKIRAMLDMKLTPRFETPQTKGKLRINYNIKNVPAMRDAFSMKIDQAAKLIAMGRSINEVNEALSLGFPEVEWGHIPLVNANQALITDIIEGNTEGSGGADVDQTDEDDEE